MKKLMTLSALVLLAAVGLALLPPGFLQKQLQYPRVRQAQKEKAAGIEQLFTKVQVKSSDFDLFIRGLKKEQVLEVFVKNKADNTYQLLTTYPFCASTGSLGPKRKSGDKQIPEGFYVVDKFNPQSKYHLSFQINYPNASDLIFADKINPGNEIFIHGECATIGCIPIGNDYIKELYLIAAMAYHGGGQLDVHIYPTRMDAAGQAFLKTQEPAHQRFWESLAPVYQQFESTKTLPKVSVGSDGYYRL